MSEPDTFHDPFHQVAPRFHSFYPAEDRRTIEFLFSRKLILAARRWVYFIDKSIQRATGQTRARWQTLFAINFAEPPVTTVSLAHRLGISWPTLVRTLANLERDGLVQRFDNPEDGRSRFIELTDKGRDVFDRTKDMLDPERGKILSDFSDEDLLIATAVIDRFLAAIVRVDGRPLGGVDSGDLG